MGPPTLAGFLLYLQTALNPSAAQLPANSTWPATAFNVAMDIVNQALNAAVPDIYTLAVYNLATSNMINFAQDPPGQTFWAGLRTTYKIDAFAAGVVQSTGDQGTNTTLLVQKALENITLADLQYLKDPWGRRYLGFAQKYGSSIWGIS